MIEVEIDGAKLACVDTGAPKGDSPTLLLVHGFPLSSQMWAEQIASLRTECRVVAPDLRGFGRSTLGRWPTADVEPTLDRYADDLVALIDELEIAGPVTLAGFSMGGYVAFAMWRRHRGRFDRLALLDTRAVADTDEGRAKRLKMAEHVGEWGAARVAELMRPSLFEERTPEAIVDATLDVIARSEPAAIGAAQLAMAARPDSTPELSQIDKPTLVLVGAADAISPPGEMRSIAAAIPGARFIEVADAGHMAPVEQPAAVSAALRELVRA